jgi:RNA polymerase subunit RPABC4/transcription elongation factor Spt4
MAEEKNDISDSRHSFRRRRLGDGVDISINQFGQTNLKTDDKDEPDQTNQSGIDGFVVHPKHGLQANTMSILNSVPQVIENMLDQMFEDDPKREALVEQLENLKELESKNKVLEMESTVVITETEPKEQLAEQSEQSLDSDNFMQKIMQIDTSYDDANDLEEEEEELNLTVIKSSIIGNKNNISDTNIYCVKCKEVIPRIAKFCTECGASQVSQFCSSCGYKFDGAEKFCPNCGGKR